MKQERVVPGFSVLGYKSPASFRGKGIESRVIDWMLMLVRSPFPSLGEVEVIEEEEAIEGEEVISNFLNKVFLYPFYHPSNLYPYPYSCPYPCL